MLPTRTAAPFRVHYHPQLLSAAMESSDGRMKAYKFVAYSAVTFSVVAVLSVVLTLPMVYNYVNHVRRQMHHEISFCKVYIEGSVWG